VILVKGCEEILKKMEVINMEKVIEEFEALSKDAQRVQRETLKQILEDNASAEYLLNLGLNGRSDHESFKACVPLVTHKDLESYINRIIDGDVSPILTTKPISMISIRCVIVPLSFFVLFCFLLRGRIFGCNCVDTIKN
jgi:jasmonic acid-amino synthetase